MLWAYLTTALNTWCLHCAATHRKSDFRVTDRTAQTLTIIFNIEPQSFSQSTTLSAVTSKDNHEIDTIKCTLSVDPQSAEWPRHKAPKRNADRSHGNLSSSAEQTNKQTERGGEWMPIICISYAFPDSNKRWTGFLNCIVWLTMRSGLKMPEVWRASPVSAKNLIHLPSRVIKIQIRYAEDYL